MRQIAAVLLASLLPVSAFGQSVTESTGSRALGMGGAFVAVSDDSTAVYWNPAGLAVGPPGNLSMSWADFRTGEQATAPRAGATHRNSKFVSLGTWPIGLSYGRFEEAALVEAAGGVVRGQRLTFSQVGATVLQTLTPGFIVGSTIKYVRGAVGEGPVGGGTTSAALEWARKLDTHSRGQLDMDLGAMADMGQVRLGLKVQNLREPKFTDPAGTATSLQRQTRLGLAVLPADGLTLAIDLDLDTVDLRDGPRRILAMGGEDRIGRRWVLRGGARWSLKGLPRRTFAVGASVELRPKFWVDTHYTRGGLEADRGLGFALRAGF